MNRRTFYSIVGAILILMVGYFAQQMRSLPDTSCHPHLSYECMQFMSSDCASIGLDNTGWIVFHSYCDAGDCVGYWSYYCGLPTSYRGILLCVDDNSWQCESN